MRRESQLTIRADFSRGWRHPDTVGIKADAIWGRKGVEGAGKAGLDSGGLSR